MKKIELDSGTKNPNFIGSWTIEPISICDDLISYFELNIPKQKSGITASGLNLDKKDSIDISINPKDIILPGNEAFKAYFDTLAELDGLLADGRFFLTGENFTEADLRLFPTLYRHDPVYYLRMKLNGAKILHYPHLWRWLCRVYALPGVATSSSLIHCRQGYFGRSWNHVIPIGPNFPMPYPEAYSHPELTL